MKISTRKMPTWEQFSDSLRTQLHCSEATIQRYKSTYNIFVKNYCSIVRCTNPVQSISNGIKSMEEEFLNNEISRDQMLRMRRVAYKLQMLICDGRLLWKRNPLYDKRFANERHEKLLSDFISYDSVIHASSINLRDEGINRQFLIYLEDTFQKDISAVTVDDILTFLKYMKQKRPAGLGSLCSAMKHFFDYLIKEHILAEHLRKALNPPVKPHRKVYGILSPDEKTGILNAIDISSDIGKRDFAIFSILTDCGLRSSDICGLLLTDIDWRNAGIAIVQAKTSRPLRVPFSDRTGSALADYILNYRGKSTLPYVFVKSCSYHDTKLTSSLLCSRLTKYMRTAGIVRNSGDKISIHTYRRSLGSELIDSGSTLEMVSQMLGHNGTSATTRYISYTNEALLECALDMALLPDVKEDLYD